MTNNDCTAERLRPVVLPVYQWQPVTGCSAISPGCANCYAVKIAARSTRDPLRAGLTRPGERGDIWTGEVRFNEEVLQEPVMRQAPYLVFVCPHGDLFHEKVSNDWRDKIFRIMEWCPQHVFQVLTKRADLMLEYVTSRYPTKALAPHIQLGVSAERQIEADERIPHLLNANVSSRYITFFPLLGPIVADTYLATKKIAFVSVGTETERPAKQEWMDGIAASCSVAGVPCNIGKRLN